MNLNSFKEVINKNQLVTILDYYTGELYYEGVICFLPSDTPFQSFKVVDVVVSGAYLRVGVVR